MTEILFTPRVVSIFGDHHFILVSCSCKVQRVDRLLLLLLASCGCEVRGEVLLVLLQFLHGARTTVLLLDTFHICQRPIVGDQYLRIFFGMDYLVDNVPPN